MKKYLLIIAAALTIAGLASCNRTAQNPEFSTYTLTVQASKDAIVTKALICVYPGFGETFFKACDDGIHTDMLVPVLF